jgi:hypothetical protein
VVDDVAGDPALARCRSIPGVGGHGGEDAGEAVGDDGVLVGGLAHRFTPPSTTRV